nr:PREDICTED: uncharacterized protein LOC106702313 [Latimeria chalumnae]|eukprot:XP_014339953.1 PREDICTED: uncharacterized protein LOC106702313 [Latimeria chalumnae]
MIESSCLSHLPHPVKETSDPQTELGVHQSGDDHTPEGNESKLSKCIEESGCPDEGSKQPQLADHLHPTVKTYEGQQCLLTTGPDSDEALEVGGIRRQEQKQEQKDSLSLGKTHENLRSTVQVWNQSESSNFSSGGLSQNKRLGALTLAHQIQEAEASERLDGDHLADLTVEAVFEVEAGAKADPFPGIALGEAVEENSTGNLEEENKQPTDGLAKEEQEKGKKKRRKKSKAKKKKGNNKSSGDSSKCVRRWEMLLTKLSNNVIFVLLVLSIMGAANAEAGEHSCFVMLVSESDTFSLRQLRYCR